MLTGDAALHEAAEAFAGVLIDDRDDLDRPPVGGGVGLEVDRPHPVGCIRDTLYPRPAPAEVTNGRGVPK